MTQAKTDYGQPRQRIFRRFDDQRIFLRFDDQRVFLRFDDQRIFRRFDDARDLPLSSRAQRGTCFSVRSKDESRSLAALGMTARFFRWLLALLTARLAVSLLCRQLAWPAARSADRLLWLRARIALHRDWLINRFRSISNAVEIALLKKFRNAMRLRRPAPPRRTTDTHRAAERETLRPSWRVSGREALESPTHSFRSRNLRCSRDKTGSNAACRRRPAER